MPEEITQSLITSAQFYGVFCILILLFAFVKVLWDKHSIKEALVEVKDTLKILPFVLLYFIIINAIIGAVFSVIDLIGE